VTESVSRDNAAASVLVRLRRSDRPINLDEIAVESGVSLPEVRQVLSRLREAGFGFAFEGESVMLSRTPFYLTAYDLWGDREVGIGKLVYVVDAVDSTNRYAVSLAESGAPDGTVVMADSQHAGRGRLGRLWYSPPGVGLWISVVLKPDLSIQRMSGFALVVSVAIVRALERSVGVAASVKWPNDVMHDTRKIAGVLVEVESVREKLRYVVVGMGINVNQTAFPTEIEGIATSLALIVGRPCDRAVVARALLEELEDHYCKFIRSGLSGVLDEWRRHSLTLGRRVRVMIGDEAFSGEAVDVDDDGALIVRTAEGERRVVSGGVTHEEE
jgi:BirA family biotin operon repressor/biotin-[acetyl-CoA-carboxylase] ligase